MNFPMEYQTEVTGCLEGIRISQIDECDTEHVVILSMHQFLAIISAEDELLKEYKAYLEEHSNRSQHG